MICSDLLDLLEEFILFLFSAAGTWDNKYTFKKYTTAIVGKLTCKKGAGDKREFKAELGNDGSWTG